MEEKFLTTFWKMGCSRTVRMNATESINAAVQTRPWEHVLEVEGSLPPAVAESSLEPTGEVEAEARSELQPVGSFAV